MEEHWKRASAAVLKKESDSLLGRKVVKAKIDREPLVEEKKKEEEEKERATIKVLKSSKIRIINEDLKEQLCDVVAMATAQEKKGEEQEAALPDIYGFRNASLPSFIRVMPYKKGFKKVVEHEMANAAQQFGGSLRGHMTGLK